MFELVEKSRKDGAQFIHGHCNRRHCCAFAIPWPREFGNMNHAWYEHAASEERRQAEAPAYPLDHEIESFERPRIRASRIMKNPMVYQILAARRWINHFEHSTQNPKTTNTSERSYWRTFSLKSAGQKTVREPRRPGTKARSYVVLFSLPWVEGERLSANAQGSTPPAPYSSSLYAESLGRSEPKKYRKNKTN